MTTQSYTSSAWGLVGLCGGHFGQLEIKLTDCGLIFFFQGLSNLMPWMHIVKEMSWLLVWPINCRASLTKTLR